MFGEDQWESSHCPLARYMSTSSVAVTSYDVVRGSTRLVVLRNAWLKFDILWYVVARGLHHKYEGLQFYKGDNEDEHLIWSSLAAPAAGLQAKRMKGRDKVSALSLRDMIGREKRPSLWLPLGTEQLVRSTP